VERSLWLQVGRARKVESHRHHPREAHGGWQARPV